MDENLLLNCDFERNVAYRVLKALHAHGIRVPEDVAVVGFDDLGFAPFLNPRLTTVRAPTERLFELLENHPSELGLKFLCIFHHRCTSEERSKVQPQRSF